MVVVVVERGIVAQLLRHRVTSPCGRLRPKPTEGEEARGGKAATVRDAKKHKDLMQEREKMKKR